MRQFRRFWGQYWRVALIITLAGATVAFLLLFRLGYLTRGLSGSELQLQLQASSWHNLVHNPLDLPLKTVQWVFLTLFQHRTPFELRAPSAIFGALTLVAFAYVLRRWYGIRAAIYGTILFGFSSWFLHTSRLASYDIMQLWAVTTLIALHVALFQRPVKRVVWLYVGMILSGLLLYVPGVVWLWVIAISLHPKDIATFWQTLGTSWRRMLAIGLFLLTLVPLGYAFFRTPSFAQTWLGLPNHFGTASLLVKDFVRVPYELFVTGPNSPQLWLDRLPVLDIFSTIMCVFGIVFYARHILVPRTRLLLGIFIVGAMLAALGGPVGLSIVIPVAYLVVAAGVGYILHEWLRVFPRNPLARTLGYGLLGFAILMACLYNTRAYYVAWPHNPTTITIFRSQE